MTQKFNPKQYQGKKRVYVKVPLSPNISRLYIWNEETREYAAPSRGKPYIASRRKPGEDREKEFFFSVEKARSWQKFMETPEDPLDPKKVSYKTPLLSEVIELWRKRSLHNKAPGTKLQYDRLLGFHFTNLMSRHIEEITAKAVHKWLDDLMDKHGSRMQNPNRKGFEHELTLLKTLLNFYKRYQYEFEAESAPAYVVPINKGHDERVINVKPMEDGQAIEKKKDIPLGEFLAWRAELTVGKYAVLAPAIATVQYFDALRISEACALFWEDVFFNWDNPEESYIIIRRHIYWPRRRGHISKVLPGFKNSKYLPGGVKVLPMYPEVFEVLKNLYSPGIKGLIFLMDGKHFEYRWIQHAYDHAFKRAGLPYSATHVMRHGGSSHLLNNCQGDATLAQAQLGVTNLKTAMGYAKREENALSDFAKLRWKEWNVKQTQNTQTPSEKK